MNQTSLVGRPLHSLVSMVVGFAEKRGVWLGPLTSSSPELARLWASPSTSTGMGVSEVTALTYSTVWACVNNISTDVASLPLILYKSLPNGGKRRLTDHKLYRLLHDEPNEEMSSMTFRGIIQAHALTWGNGYAEIVRDGGGRPTALWPITPDRVQVQRETRTGQLFYQVTQPGGGQVRVAPENMLHLQGLGYDGMTGYSLIAKAREAIALGLATERFGGTFFGNGTTFGGVFRHPGRMTEQAIKNFRESVNAQHQGVDRAHKFIVVEENMQYDKLGIDPDHAQFLETRLHQVEEICRYYRMPPHKVQHLLRSTNNNIEHQGIEYYSDTLRPWCVRWEQEIKRKLIAPSERMIQFAEHKIEGVLRGDLQSRYAAYAVGRQWGWLSANRVCELENMDPLPSGGDVFLVPLNMTPADRLNEIIDKQVAPDPAPAAPSAQMDGEGDMQQAGRMATAIREALVEVEARIVATTAEITRVRSEQGQTQEEAEAVKAELEALQEKQTADAQEAGQLRVLLLEATERADRLAVEQEAFKLAAADEEASLRAQVDAAHAEAQTVKAQGTEEASRLQALADAAADQAAALAAERDTLRAAHEQAATEAATLATALTGTKEEAEALKAQAAAEAARLQAEVDATATRMAQVEADRLVMQQTAVAADLALTTLRADLQAAEALYAETSQALESEHGALDAARAQLAQLQATIAETQRDVARLAAEGAAKEADAITATTAAEEAHRASAEAAAKLATATADAEAARQLLEEETARLQAEREAHTATQAALKAQEDAHAARNQSVLAAQRDLVHAQMGRLILKVTERARRNKGTPAKLKAWADSNYLLLEDTYIDALRPVMRAHLAFIGSAQDVDSYTRGMIHAQLEQAHSQIRTVADGDPEEFPVAIEKLLTRWEQDHPTAIADVVFQEEMTYVRSL